jgi:hypothetical protein
MRARCGKPMRRCEAANGPMPEPPACGRPEGHPGPCRTVPALIRYSRADKDRILAARRAGRYRYPDRRRGKAAAA